jgi:uncharacterized membrane protein
MPFSPYHLLLFMLLLGAVMAFVQVGLVQLTFQKLGLSSQSGFMLLFSSLLGSAINVPLYSVRAKVPPVPMDPFYYGLLRSARLVVPGRTVIAVNLGGCLIPMTFSLYLFMHTPLSWIQVTVATTVVAAFSYVCSRPIRGLGVAMPPLVAPLAAALTAMALGGEHRAPLAYICGSLGVVVGADVLRLRDIPRLGAPLASIGGAGTFDGIFLTGLLAVLLT